MSGQQRATLCPGCGTQMKLAKVTGRAYGRYRLITYACESCNLAYTEGESDGDNPEPKPEPERE